jgi:hypothetical protein
MMRLRATNTHLYPGARLRAEEGAAELRKGDAVAIEFADLQVAIARVATTRRDGQIELAVASHRTGKGTAIAAKRWLGEPLGGEEMGYRIVRRLDRTG